MLSRILSYLKVWFKKIDLFFHPASRLKSRIPRRNFVKLAPYSPFFIFIFHWFLSRSFACLFVHLFTYRIVLYSGFYILFIFVSQTYSGSSLGSHVENLDSEAHDTTIFQQTLYASKSSFIIFRFVIIFYLIITAYTYIYLV